MANTLPSFGQQLNQEDKTIADHDTQRTLEETEDLEDLIVAEDTKSDKDRRRSKRKAAVWKCEIEFENDLIECESRNVSGTGALLKAYQLIEIDICVHVRFHVYHNGYNRLLRIYSRIVRISFEHDVFNIAVHFEESDSSDIEFLQEYGEGNI